MVEALMRWPQPWPNSKPLIHQDKSYALGIPPKTGKTNIFHDVI